MQLQRNPFQARNYPGESPVILCNIEQSENPRIFPGFVKH
jgi:hypothetical protein